MFERGEKFGVLASKSEALKASVNKIKYNLNIVKDVEKQGEDCKGKYGEVKVYVFFCLFSFNCKHDWHVNNL